MEITNEIIIKIFAQYYGVECLCKVPDLENKQFIIVDGDFLSKKGQEFFTEAKLYLKPLSVLTDEDALEVSRITGHASHLTDESQIFQAKELLKSPNFFVSQTNLPGYKWLQITQYLQSKGYDLPQYLLRGKTLFEAELAIYE